MSNIRALDRHLMKGNFSWCLLCYKSVSRYSNNQATGVPHQFRVVYVGVSNKLKISHVWPRKVLFFRSDDQRGFFCYELMGLSILAVNWECHQSDPILVFYAFYFVSVSFIQAILRESDASAVVKTSHCLENGDSVNLWRPHYHISPGLEMIISYMSWCEYVGLLWL